MKLIKNLGRIIMGVMCAGVVLTTANSCEYDDTYIRDSIKDLDERVEALEAFSEQIQSEISALQEIIEKLQSEVTIDNIVETEDGYTINFSDGTSITITDGEDGKDGQDGEDGKDGMTPPTIIVIEEDGTYYWGYENSDGSRDFITDDDGNKIPVTGEAPQIRINPDNGNWEISTDGGQTWEDTGMPSSGTGTGESLFAGIDQDEDFVYLTLRDGTTICIPKTKELVFDFGTDGETLYFERGESKVLDYTMSGVQEVTITKPDGWRASIEAEGFVITAPVEENTFAETEGIVTVLLVASNGQSLIAKQPVIIGVAPQKDYFTIEVPEDEIGSTSARIISSCNEPTMYWTSQIMTLDEFETYVGSVENMEYYFMELLESTAYYYGYSSVAELLPDFLYPGDYVDDYVYSGLYSETAYMTYAVGMDFDGNYLTDFYYGPQFTTTEPQMIDLTFDLNVTPKTTSALLDIYPSDPSAYYFATVIDNSFYEAGYTDVDIMTEIINSYSWMLFYYALQGDVTGYEISGMASNTDYYAVVFGVDVDAITYTTEMTKVPFTTLESQPTDAYVEGSITNWWSIDDLAEYNPDYASLMGDPSNPNLAAVDLEFNESAVACIYVLWIGDLSTYDYDELYAATQQQGDIAYYGDPANLFYVALDNSYNTLCTIALDADGNYGEMDICLVQFTEEGKSTDFALFDEYYNAIMGGYSMTTSSVNSRPVFMAPSNIENVQIREALSAKEVKVMSHKVVKAVNMK